MNYDLADTVGRTTGRCRRQKASSDLISFNYGGLRIGEEFTIGAKVVRFFGE